MATLALWAGLSVGLAGCGDDSATHGVDAATDDARSSEDLGGRPDIARADSSTPDAGADAPDVAPDSDGGMDGAADRDGGVMDAAPDVPDLGADATDAVVVDADDPDAPFDAARYRGDASRPPCPVGSECEAGEREPVTGCPAGESSERICRDDCVWGEPTVCVPPCTRPPMPSRTGADPVCIPAGLFILGGEIPRGFGGPSSLPVREITLSEYYIDRYPVTMDRYMACIQDGGCTGPLLDIEFGSLRISPPGPAHFASFIYERDRVAQFCRWDGGELPTEYQWEKAARGPAPRAPRHAWGDGDGDDCQHHSGSACFGTPFSIHAMPASVSAYGVRLLGSIWEYTSGYAFDGYEEIADTDPSTGVPPNRPLSRGWRWSGIIDAVPSTAVYRHEHPGADGFRCVY
ncbi:MAG: SUMF1/EgtB/PvdO family nonheme iron enzyme [Deltaproteobacteria bacterium]|nr:SUMF1/EgtB/PvdO family nonheme iron enzyme [Deltaproteobacteria bacterium]